MNNSKFSFFIEKNCIGLKFNGDRESFITVEKKYIIYERKE